jgi:hypothetical protein
LCGVSDLSPFMLVETNMNIRACQASNEQERDV